jgi:hypothetical protein
MRKSKRNPPAKPPIGRPNTLASRPDSEIKTLILQAGGVIGFQKILASGGVGYTRMGIYQWLKTGHVPQRTLELIRLCIRRHDETLARNAAQALTSTEAAKARHQAVRTARAESEQAANTAPADTAPPPEAPAGWGRGSL